MAVYKVPQDVEADDKLIGPFSFRQFIYLIIVAISMAASWGLSQLFIPLAIVPLPFIVFFAALALPLRKDQPMEAYLSAVVSFYFMKSRKRLWQPDGIDSFVTIIPPKGSDKVLTKGFDESEATKRLSYLAELVDTHGWAIRGADGTPDTSINTDLYYESQAEDLDMFTNQSQRAQEMAQRLNDKASEEREDARANMQKVSKSSTAEATPEPQPAQDAPTLDELLKKEQEIERKAEQKEGRDAVALATALAEEASEMQSKTASQPITQPIEKTVSKEPTKDTANTSVSTPDTGTMELTREQAEDLSKRDDLKVNTVAEEANRLAKKNKALKDGDEVTISFR